MSLEKIKIKPNKHSDTYSKNPILNSLIKHKLQGQIDYIKQASNKVIQRQLSNNLVKHEKTLHSGISRDRIKSITSFSMEKIRSQIDFNPIPDNLFQSFKKSLGRQFQDLPEQKIQVLAFASSRQKNSALLPQKELSKIIKARRNSQLLEVKLKAEDQIQYKPIISQSVQLNIDNNREKLLDLQNKIKQNIKQFNKELWLPQMPELKADFQEQAGQQYYKQQFKKNKNVKLGFRANSEEKIRIKKKQESSNYQNQLVSQKSKKLSGNAQQTKLSFPKMLKSSFQKKSLIYGQAKHFQQQKIQNLRGAQYQHKKYHKDDYKNLDIFLMESLNSLNAHFNQNAQLKANSAKKVMFADQDNKKAKSSVQLSPSEHLEKTFAIYLSVFLELIRLTYIQSFEKGLLLEKIINSHLKLMKSIFLCQHKINFKQFEQLATTMRQERQMYEDRMAKLENLIQQLKTEKSSLCTSEKKLALTATSYQRVNAQLFADLQYKTRKCKQLQTQNKYMRSKYHMLLNDLVEKQMIYHDDKKMYIINKYYQPEILMNLIQRGPESIKTQMNQKFYLQSIQQAKDLSKQQIGKNNPDKNKHKYTDLPNNDEWRPTLPSVAAQQALQKAQVGKTVIRIKNIENQLNKIWYSKQQDLDLKSIIAKYDVQFSDQCFGTSDDITYDKQVTNIGIQVGQTEKKIDFEAFLKKKLQQEKSHWQKKQAETNNLYISLQQLYQDNNKIIVKLTSQITSYKNQTDTLKQKIKQAQEKLMEANAMRISAQQTLKQQRKIFDQQMAKQQLQKDLALKKVIDLQKIKKQLEKFNKMQKQNSEMLVKKNLELDTKFRKAEKYQKQFDSLSRRVRNVAPWLEKFMQRVDAIKNDNENYNESVLTLWIQVSQQIEQNLSDYVEKDAGVFNLTK